jgi:hypothetical protein
MGFRPEARRRASALLCAMVLDVLLKILTKQFSKRTQNIVFAENYDNTRQSLPARF